MVTRARVRVRVLRQGAGPLETHSRAPFVKSRGRAHRAPPPTVLVLAARSFLVFLRCTLIIYFFF